MAANSSEARSAPAKAERAEDERARLLRAAMDVLQRNGWWGFKVESVLRQAGLSTRSFYRHFEKKSDLLVALLEHELGIVAVYLRQMTAAAATPSDKVRAFVTASMDMAYEENLTKPSSLFALHWREMLAEYPDTIDQCVDHMMKPLIEAVQEGSATGEFGSEDPVAPNDSDGTL